MTEAELEGLEFLAKWELARAAIGYLIYRLLFGKWFHQDVPMMAKFIWSGIRKLWDWCTKPGEPYDIMALIREGQAEQAQKSAPVEKESTDPDDYWDEGGVRRHGGAYSYGGATVRHPKNVDRAYSGSVERFHDGEW